MARVAGRAGVSSADFYKHFKTRDDCFLAAYDDAVERIRERVLAACAEGEDRPAAVRAALAALLGHLAAEPAQARLVLVEGLFGGRPLYDRYQRALDSFAPYLREASPTPADGPKCRHIGDISAHRRDRPEPKEEALIGGIVALITRRVLAGQTDTLEDLLPELTRFALTSTQLER